MFYKVLYFLCVAAEIFVVPKFLSYYWPQRCKKSFIWKTVASTIFVLIGLFAMKASGNISPYATYIVWGLVLGMAGAFIFLKEKCTLTKIVGIILILSGLAITILK